METLKIQTKQCSEINFMKNLAHSKSQSNTNAHKRPVDHRNVSPVIKEMWEVYMGFAKQDFK